MNLTQLFNNVNNGVQWQTAGNDVNYALIRENDKLYIYFQGSSSTTDWIRNFLFKKRPYKDMGIPYRVHRGFLKAWKEVEDIIINAISDKEIKAITIVGYSHGGALAAFCHECCYYHRQDIKDNILGIAFEAPRIFGCIRVKKSLIERWERFFVIRNDKDIVTHCPPKIFGYTHVGNILHVGRYKGYGLIDSHRQANILESIKEIDFDIENKIK